MRAPLLYKLKDENGIVDTEWRKREINNEEQITFDYFEDLLNRYKVWKKAYPPEYWVNLRGVKQKLVSVIIPQGVEYIKTYAFAECEALEEIIIPDSVTSIMDYAFSYCASLREVKIPDSVSDIGKFAFSTCSNLKRITIPEGVTRIRKGTFKYCDSLEEVIIPKSVTRIGRHAFKGCPNLTIHCSSKWKKYCERNKLKYELID